MKRSTSEVHNAGLFKAHGQADYEVDGRIVYVQAVGPFNAELIPALSQTVAHLIASLAQSGNWAQVITFRNSALCSPETLSAFAASLRQRYTHPATNPVIALVFGPEVEGAGIMPTVLRKCYTDAALQCNCFTDREAALQWALSQLA